MIAEDDELNVQILRWALSRVAKEVIVARNGKEAVEKYLLNADIHLILMDINMPEMDGFEAASQIRHHNQKVVIIAQTSLNSDFAREKAKTSGCNNFINKPVTRSVITGLVEKHFCDTHTATQ